MSDMLINGLPNLCGSEGMIEETLRASRDRVRVPARERHRLRKGSRLLRHSTAHAPAAYPGGRPRQGRDMRHEPLIGNLQFMQESPYEQDRHNADVFRRCYKRMGEFVPQLVEEGKNPRVMLDYTGTLLHGLCQMGAYDVIDSLKTITCDPRYRRCVEWLGTTWGHAVAPSTPPQDYRFHIRAWQHHFSAIFGLEALSRVRGFVPSELALPNHPGRCL